MSQCGGLDFIQDPYYQDHNSFVLCSRMEEVPVILLRWQTQLRICVPFIR